MSKIEINKKILSVSIVDTKQQETESLSKVSKKNTLIRHDVVKGFTLKIKYKENSFYVTLNFDSSGKLLEIFVNASSTSPEINTYVQALARLISNQLKYGIEINSIIKHLDGMDSGESNIVRFPGQNKSKFIKSIPDLLAKILSYYGEKSKIDSIYKELSSEQKENQETQTVLVKENKQNNFLQCPECKENTMILRDGCYTCVYCGYSKCS